MGLIRPGDWVVPKDHPISQLTQQDKGPFKVVEVYELDHVAVFLGDGLEQSTFVFTLPGVTTITILVDGERKSFDGVLFSPKDWLQ